MIYSRWRPDRGGYDYYESGERRGLGDDLPVPDMPMGTAIGVASTDIGRVPSGSVRHVGSGAVARGSLMPISRAGLGLGGLNIGMSLSGLTGILLGAAFGWWLRGRRR